MKSYVKLYGPKLSEGLEELESLFKDKKDVAENLQPKKFIGTVMDAMNIPDISDTTIVMGEYDFSFDWGGTPTIAEIKKLIRLIDDALVNTGCRYTITTM